MHLTLAQSNNLYQTTDQSVKIKHIKDELTSRCTTLASENVKPTLQKDQHDPD